MNRIYLPCPHEEPRGAAACPLCRAASLGQTATRPAPTSRGTPMPGWFKDTVHALMVQQATSQDELPIDGWGDQ